MNMMEAMEPTIPLDLCLLCGELAGDYKKTTRDTTDYSNKRIYDTLATFIMINTPHQQQLHNDSSICQNCFIKLNELDQHQVIADRIKFDLLNVYNYTHRLHYPEVKVKIETDESAPNVEFDDELEENFIDMGGPESPEMEFIQISKKIKRRMDFDDDVPKKKKRGPRPKNSKDYADKIITHFVNGMTHYQCKICGRTVKKRAQITQHIQIHTTERNICCQECGMMFKTQSCLYSHRKIHMEREKMVCDLCGKTFDKKYYLLEHMNAIHLDVREHTCTVCGAAFARKRSLIKHAFVHQTEADKKVICEVCGFKSHTRQGMKRHSKTHTGEKNYACEICDKRFACRYNVTAHVNSVHKGIRPKVDESKLRCMLCGRRFPRQKQLRRHLYEEHNMLNYAAEFTGIQM